MYNSVKDKLDGYESNDKVIVEEVILPEIEKRYGLFNEQSEEMLYLFTVTNQLMKLLVNLKIS